MEFHAKSLDMQQASLNTDIILNFENTISPYREMIAYETLWAMKGMTEKKLSELFKEKDNFPSLVLNSLKDPMGFDNPFSELEKKVEEYIRTKLGKFSICVNRDFQYPVGLRHAEHPIELFYYLGNLDLTQRRSVSVVGAREVSDEGIKRAIRLTKELVQNNFLIVSGLAKGVDTAALTTAIQEKGDVIAVIGTPIDEHYPKENAALQNRIAQDHLLISQVPFYRYKNEPFISHRNYFPRRNVTMAALTEATIIVEASDTSGSLTQARACMHQGKKLFILDSCFQKKDLKWPWTYLERGAIRVKTSDDVFNHLKR